MTLQAGNVIGDGCIRQLQLIGCPAETVQFDYATKNSQ